MKETNIENFDGYVVYSYYVECPYPKANNKSRRKKSVLRNLAFFALAPFAILADAVIAVFK